MALQLQLLPHFYITKIPAGWGGGGGGGGKRDMEINTRDREREQKNERDIKNTGKERFKNGGNECVKIKRIVYIDGYKKGETTSTLKKKIVYIIGLG